MSARHSRQDHNRARIATEAARLFVEHGMPDFGSAKRKALQQLRLGAHTALPADNEVELAVAEYLRLFRSESQPAELARLRQVALKLMSLLRDFSPKLVGPVLSGLADEDSVIVLHLLADPPEAVQWYLMERRVRFEIDEVHMVLSGGGMERLPAYHLEFQGAAVELVVFSGRQRRKRPLSSPDGKAMERAGIAEVEGLLAAAPPI